MPHKDPEARKAYYLSRRDKQLAYGKEYRQKNREALNEKQRHYRKNLTLEQKVRRSEYNRAYNRKILPNK